MSSEIQTSINAHVAARIRILRKEVGLTQQEVARQLGISFHQLQKYEHGKNRVSAGRLYQLAAVLETNIEAFFAGYKQGAAQDAKRPTEVSRLARQFEAISSTEIKKSIYGLIRVLDETRTV
ncbi:helix-turn-helix domain-containing protein [Pelagibius sp. Alg239-R121]|uniref:helix-turn-helix domain-containing protein n=1 Tax=Pelagibius sp. Alg239-R121 TaxID=2993448 RepID=UPI0024A741E7|nr:helix-turn-helix transcriptional regulator [Pelagibius sp. Alg239-R121]